MYPVYSVTDVSGCTLCCAIGDVGFVPVYYGPVLRGTATFPLKLHFHAAAASLWSCF
jgi:hypothetical protein